MDGMLHGLNAAQRAAVTSPAPVLQVLAPPGSGKTKTLTTRVAHQISQEQLKPWNIITCTFTKKAANEMKERIRSFVGEELAKQIKLGTFHAIAAQYLRQYGQHIGLPKDFGIADAPDSKAILKRIIKKNDFGLEPGRALGRISSHKCKALDPERLANKPKNVEQQEFSQLFAEYTAELEASNLLDYDDLLLKCCFLLRTHPQCVSNVQAVLVDEFQDTNNIQYDLMSLFAQKRNVITIVGDPDQSIYGWRNAEIGNLTRMQKQWPDTLTINLEENYRSSGAILHAAQTIIEQDEGRPPKRLQATHSHGQRPVLRKLPSAAAEAAWLVAEIKRMRALTGNMLEASDFAILLRSAALSRVIEAALGKEGVPYRMVGGVKFFERAEVKLVLDYLRVINQPGNNEAVERIINVPPRKVGEVTVKSLRDEASTRVVSLWRLVCSAAKGHGAPRTKLSKPAQDGLAKFVNVILTGQKKLLNPETRQVSLVDVINTIAQKIDLQKYLKDKWENEHEARWTNVEELVAQAADMSDPERLRAMMQEDVLPAIDGLDQRAPSNADVLSIFLANVALSTSAEERAADGSEPVQQVTISTIHSAKGLEWPVVFIPACYEGSIPHSRAEDNDEERRLLYVAMTRAQAMLYLSCPVKNTQREDATMSSFLLQPGVSNFFEEHGPSMSLASASALAITLRRESPSADAFEEGKATLDRSEDDYWPLNGEESPEELAKWDYGRAVNPLPAFGTTKPASWLNATSVSMSGQQDFSTIPKTGFSSVKDKFDEISEKNRIEAIDKRAKHQRATEVHAPKGRKRQIEGQSTISGFLAKRRQLSPEAELSLPGNTTPSGRKSRLNHSLHAVSNIDQASDYDPLPTKPVRTANHNVRTAPLRQPTHSQAAAPARGYVFLSSSPPAQETDENEAPETATGDEAEEAAGADAVAFRPASTFHTTSMLSMKQTSGQGRRYGVKPSFNGWANRAHR